jgi:hypothetical protein
MTSDSDSSMQLPHPEQPLPSQVIVTNDLVTSNYKGPSVLASPHIKSVACAGECLTCALYGLVLPLPVLPCLALLIQSVSACLHGWAGAWRTASLAPLG